MNYLAHASVLGATSPDRVLGAALPDLLRSLDRRLPRLVPAHADRLEAAGAVELAQGVRAHHAADLCFHELPAFHEACGRVGELVQAVASADREPGRRVRGFFLGHVLVELLLDAELALREPSLSGDFYRALAAADRSRAARALEAACGAAHAPAGRAWTATTSSVFEAQLERFVAARFLDDYATDEGLAHRLGQVLGRARQTLGPAGQARLVLGLPGARAQVRELREALVAPARDAVLRALR